MFFATGESEKKNGEKVKNHEVNKIDGCERCEYGVSMEYVIIEGGDDMEVREVKVVECER